MKNYFSNDFACSGGFPIHLYWFGMRFQGFRMVSWLYLCRVFYFSDQQICKHNFHEFDLRVSNSNLSILIIFKCTLQNNWEQMGS